MEQPSAAAVTSNSESDQVTRTTSKFIRACAVDEVKVITLDCCFSGIKVIIVDLIRKDEAT